MRKFHRRTIRFFKVRRDMHLFPPVFFYAGLSFQQSSEEFRRRCSCVCSTCSNFNTSNCLDRIICVLLPSEYFRIAKPGRWRGSEFRPWFFWWPSFVARVQWPAPSRFWIRDKCWLMPCQPWIRAREQFGGECIFPVCSPPKLLSPRVCEKEQQHT